MSSKFYKNLHKAPLKRDIMEKKKYKYFEIILIVIFSLLIYFVAALYNDAFTEIMSVATYLTWHNIFEFLSIFLSFLIFMVTYYIYEESGNLRIMIPACAFLTMGFIDTFHTLSYIFSCFIYIRS